jgi:putative pyruvate formate lyase activating enzyme
MMDDSSPLERCNICPRRCGANRIAGERGFCGARAEVVVSHYGPHFGEEPPLSGKNGSGNVFFSPCNLRCIFCQNHQISHETFGKTVSSDGLADIFLELQNRGVHNINLVSPTPYIPQIAAAIRTAKKRGVKIPFVYNTNAYEAPDMLALLNGLIDIYLPDFKYWHESAGKRLSGAPGYPETARSAIIEMQRQAGNLDIDKGLARRGLLIRLLVLPGGLAGTKSVLRWIKDSFGTQTHISLMSQYYPLHQANLYPMVARSIRKEEYDEVIDLALEEGFENIFGQEMDSAPLFIPDFAKEEPFGKTMLNVK